MCCVFLLKNHGLQLDATKTGFRWLHAKEQVLILHREVKPWVSSSRNLVLEITSRHGLEITKPRPPLDYFLTPSGTHRATLLCILFLLESSAPGHDTADSFFWLGGQLEQVRSHSQLSRLAFCISQGSLE